MAKPQCLKYLNPVCCVVQVSWKQPDEFSSGNICFQSQRPPEAGQSGTCPKWLLLQTLPKIQAGYGTHHSLCTEIILLFEVMCWSVLLLFNLFDLRFDAFMDYSIPEILRVPLEELCLHIMVYEPHTVARIWADSHKHYWIFCLRCPSHLSLNSPRWQKCQYGSPEDFLSRALDAPQPQSVSNAVNLLRKIGACHLNNHLLTPLGHHLASLPVNVKIGKMLIYGAIFGCLEPIVRPTA